ncbi:MAG: GNAT family N-acetyltransferase [Candidatus Thorarchaeota archaeon]
MDIREMKSDEIDFALELTDIEQWATPRFDFELLEAYSPSALFVLESNTELLGMISAVGYERTGYIGMLIVPEKWRKKGYGQRLMTFGLQYLWDLGVESIMLDAVQDIVPLYENLGFERVCESLRFRGRMISQISGNVRKMTSRDLPEVMKIDHIHFGEDRSFFLKRIYEQFPEFSKVLVNDEDQITGFIQARRCPDDIYVGPWIVNRSAESPERLLTGIASDGDECAIRVGVLETSRNSSSLVSEIGLERGRSSIRMLLRRGTEMAFSTGMYAIGSPVKG